MQTVMRGGWYQSREKKMLVIKGVEDGQEEVARWSLVNEGLTVTGKKEWREAGEKMLGFFMKTAEEREEAVLRMKKWADSGWEVRRWRNVGGGQV